MANRLRRKSRFGVAILMAASPVAFAGGNAAAQSSAPATDAVAIDFNIQAQPLVDAMRAFSQVTGVQAVYATSVGMGVASQGVRGRMSTGEALSRLLAGTGVTFRYVGPQTVTLEPAPPAKAGAIQLGPVQVDGATTTGPLAADAPPPVYAGGQVARGGRVGMLGNRDVLDTPFNQTSYTAELIENQQARTVGDVLDNDPSVRRAWPASGFYEYFQIRGFNINSQDISFNGLYGMVPRYGGLPVDFAERVEVLKGASALLSGISPDGVVGGAINIVPKRAGDTPLTGLTVGLESDTLWHAHLDAGRRFGPDGEWGIRINAKFEDGGTYIDGQSKHGSNTESVALDYRGERLRLALDAYRVEDRNFGGASMAIDVADDLTAVPAAPRGSTNISPWGTGTGLTNVAMLSGEYDIADHVTAYAKAGYRHYQYSGYLLSSAYDLESNGDASVLMMQFPYNTHGDSEEAGLKGEFHTGPIKHELVLSGSRQTDNVKDKYSFNVVSTNIYDPASPAVPETASPTPVRSSALNFGSVALADTLSVVDERIQLTLGIRRQNVKSWNYSLSTGALTASYDDSAWTPMVGLVVKATENLSFYGNSIQALSVGSTVGNTYNNAGQVFPPYKTKQIEFGAKLQTGHVINTLSLFQIRKPSTLVDNSTSPLPTLELNGEQRNRGIEWAVFGAVVPSLRVLGGVTYTQARLTKTQGGAQDGNAAPGAAPWATNLGAEWDVPHLHGLTLTGRVINTSSQYVDDANTLKIPGWTRVDVGPRYTVSVGEKPVTFRANIENLLNKRYWEGVNSPGTITLGAPRTFQVSATVDF